MDESTPPPGVKAYVTGLSPLVSDQFNVGSKSSKKVTLITFAVIALMLLWVYRRITTVWLTLVTVAIRWPRPGVVAVLAHNNIIGLSVYSTNLLTLLAIAAGTDYMIFLTGRFQEARHAGESGAGVLHHHKGTSHVVLGSA